MFKTYNEINQGGRAPYTYYLWDLDDITFKLKQMANWAIFKIPTGSCQNQKDVVALKPFIHIYKVVYFSFVTLGQN